MVINFRTDPDMHANKKKIIIFFMNLASRNDEQFGLCIGIIRLSCWHIAWSKTCDVVCGHHFFSFKNTEVSIIVTEQNFFLFFFFLTWIQFQGVWNFHSLKKIRTRIPMTGRMIHEQINGEIIHRKWNYYYYCYYC